MAGNFELESSGPQAVTVAPELEPSTNVDIGNHATEQIPVSSNTALKFHYLPLEGPQADRTDLENHKSDPAHKSLESGLHSGVKSEPICVCPLDHNAENVVENQNMHVEETRYGHLDFLNVTTQLDEDFFGTLDGTKAKEVSVSDSKVDDHVTEELAGRIRMARGLQCLNLTGNGLSTEVLKRLWEAWCHGGRTAKRDFLGKAHFAVQDGRECTALITGCLSCQLGAGSVLDR